MAGARENKRTRVEATREGQARPTKKQRQRRPDQEAELVDADELDFQAVNLLDSDEEDLDNADVDDLVLTSADAESGSSQSEAESSPAPPNSQNRTSKPARKPEVARDDAPDNENSTDSSEDEADEDENTASEAGSSASAIAGTKPKSKRNDPSAFATSLSKILGTKLSTTRRSDPVLARSVEAQAASREAVDAALEAKAKRRIREQKRLAMEKGRVRDVLVASTAINLASDATNADAEAEGKTTAQILETERRLRKVAQRGVVKLFNAVRAAQVKAAEADRASKADGVVGIGRREEKVTGMSKKGFLDLIASGGGGLKKAPLEEA